MKVLTTASLLLPIALMIASCASKIDRTSSDSAGDPTVNVASAVAAEGSGVHVNVVTEAPTGFDNLTNGFATQADMDAALDAFANELMTPSDGLGPLYNAPSCGSCHCLPFINCNVPSYFACPPGSPCQPISAIPIAPDPELRPVIPDGAAVQPHLSLSLRGDGYVEAIDSNTLVAIQASQPAAQRGTFIQVPVLEAGNQVRGGRFGWKDQHASLLSFAAAEYLIEEGITSPLQPTENTSFVGSVAAFDTVADPEDVGGTNIASFALFMRSLKAPSVDATAASTASAQNGSQVFNSIGCAVCHIRTITTAPAGTVINSGALTVPAALGDKNIHPLSDFLLHDIGTGDGVVLNGGQGTSNMVRTPALWGMRTRVRLMHDGASFTRTDAILRHANQAAIAKNNFVSLSSTSQQDLINFLNSL